MFNKGLAYQAEVPVNWCPALGTVLANEEIIDGKSERGNHPVVRMPMRQVQTALQQLQDCTKLAVKAKIVIDINLFLHLPVLPRLPPYTGHNCSAAYWRISRSTRYTCLACITVIPLHDMACRSTQIFTVVWEAYLLASGLLNTQTLAKPFAMYGARARNIDGQAFV